MYIRKCPSCDKDVHHKNRDDGKKAERKRTICRECNGKKTSELFESKRILKEEKRAAKYRQRAIDTYCKFDEERNTKILQIFDESGANWNVFKKAVQPCFKQFQKEMPTLFYRTCPGCYREIGYKTKIILNQTIKKNTVCASCVSKGENNHFFGKHHTQESKDKIRESHATSEAWAKQVAFKRTDEYRQMMSEQFSGEGNPRYGKGSLLNFWVKNLGQEAGEKRFEEWKKLQSINSSGENNPMYGKPSPSGSGNGWSGWYKGFYFRSICELSYVVNVLEKNNLPWRTAETNDFKIDYVDYKGANRTYFPDFFVDEKYLVECKPKKLHTSTSVADKAAAAILFCNERGWTYQLIEPPRLTPAEMISLHALGDIVFLPRYEEKFITWKEKDQKFL